MKLEYTIEQQRFRQEIRDWLQSHVPAEPLASFDTGEGFEQHRNWERILDADRWSMVTWPQEYGGRGCDLIEWLIFEEEYYRAGAPARVNQNGIFLLGPTLMEYGTPEQKARFLPPMASGKETWAQGWSEPGAGSDMAAIRCTSIRRPGADGAGDHYLLNGQKIWSTRAVFADWLFGLFRSDPQSARHHGLTFLLVSLKTPGITVRPIRQLDGLPGFAEVFFDNVQVPVANRLGDEGQGWKIAMATAGFERGLMLRSPARFQEAARRLVALFFSRPEAARRDPSLRDRVLQAYADAEAFALNTYKVASHLLEGGKIGSEASLTKIFWSELDLELHETALAILGSHSEVFEDEAVSDTAHWLNGYLFSLAGPIYAGTNEIQRNIIAERLLGLPR